MKSLLNRFLLLYFLLLAIPLAPRYFAELFTLPGGLFRYQNLFVLAHYVPRFFGSVPIFADWLVIAVLALIGAAVWQRRDSTPDWSRWRYWVTAVVRYRLAIALLAYGFIKIFPLQAPFPTLSNLNTPYGDFTRWKLFAMSLGIVPNYEAFLGGVEVVAALLLLYRKTASIGALVILFFTGNVFMSNLAYEGGEYVYSAYLITLALFVLSYDAYRLASLVILRRPTEPNHWRLSLTQPWQRYGRWAVKGLVVLVFAVIYGVSARSGSRHDPYQIPRGNGLAGAAGLYNVALFKEGHDTLSYSPTDRQRWSNVVFERWSTLSIASNQPADIDSGNTERITAVTNLDKTYESQGTNGRRYYDYAVDTVDHLLRLTNKDPKDSLDTWTLRYDRPDSTHIVLSGLSPAHDSLYVVLDRIDKKYLLEEATRSGRNNHQLKL